MKVFKNYFIFKGKLEWLGYNIKRSLGIESSNQAEQEFGANEVVKAIRAL